MDPCSKLTGVESDWLIASSPSGSQNSQWYCRLMSTPRNDAAHSLCLLLAQLKFHLGWCLLIAKQTLGRYRFIQWNCLVSIQNIGESQPQVSLCHHRTYHPSPRESAAHRDTWIRGNSDFITERCQRSIGRYKCPKLCQTHDLICLKHGDGAQQRMRSAWRGELWSCLHHGCGTGPDKMQVGLHNWGIN